MLSAFAKTMSAVINPGFRCRKSVRRCRRIRQYQTQSHLRRCAVDSLEERIVMSANVLYDHPGTTFDADLFAANIEASLNGVVRGFGYSIMENGQQGPADGGGVALSSADLSAIIGVPAGGIAFNEDTRLEIASVSKNFTAAALMIAVENHPFASLDHPMAAYLPTSWTLGNNVETISLRNLAQHTSGIGENYTTTATASNPIVGPAAGAAVDVDFNTFSTNTWANLQTVVAYGVENTYANSSLDDNPQVGSFWYSNLNYSLMRVIIPILSGAVDATETDPQAYADEFRDFLNDNIFGPAGIGNIDMEITGALQARVYLPVSTDPAAASAGATTGDDNTLFAGAIGLKMTPSEIATAAAYLYNEDTSPLSPGAIQEMQDQFLGFLASRSQPNGNYGAYYAHDGGLSAQGTPVRRMLSTVNVFPNDVQAAVIVNSDTIGGLNMSAIVQNAYDNSWRRVAVGGSSGNDTFVVDTDASGNNVILTITTPSSTEILTAPVSVLEELTLVGFNGDDVFIVNRLPASVELSIRAGLGSDRLDLTQPGGNLTVIAGAVHFHGGPVGDPGTDTINFYDDQNGANHDYVLSESAFNRTGMGAVTHTRTERFNLWAGWGHNTIRLNSLGIGDEAMIDAGGGNDTIVLGNGNLSGNIRGLVDIVTGHGSDELILDDRNGSVADDFYVFQTGYFQSAVIPVIEWNTDSPPELITLLGSNEDSTTNIQNVADGVTLRVNGRGGNDVMNLHAVEPGGRVRMNGGSGNDTMSLTPVSRDLDMIRGEVIAIGSDGNFDTVHVHDEQNSADGRLYRFNNNRFDVIGSPFGRLTYSGSVEQLHVYAGDDDDIFDVRSIAGPTLVSAIGNGGSDTFRVASTARDLDVINGPLHFAGGSGDGTDRVFLHDENDTGNDNYSIVTDPPSTVSRPGFLLTHTGVEDLTLNANDGNNNITMGGSWALQTTNYTINAGGGNDTVTVNASAPMNVLVNGGAGTLDRVHIRATLNDDEVTLLDRTVTIGATQVTFGTGVERRSLDAQAGTDLLTVIGVDGNDEHIIVRASTTPGSGSVQTPSTHLDFVGLEDVTVQGNPGDRDTLAFYGTAQADDFAINPVAQGTADSVVASLGNGLGSTLLRLRDFSHVGIPTFFGGLGADTFRVTVFPTTPEFAIRSVRLDGGTERPGARPAVDTLIMNYNESLFTQLSPPATAPTGTVRLQHEDELLAALYGNFEAVLGNIL